jgi:hypothetical protein
MVLGFPAIDSHTAELLVATGTFALAIATLWLGWNSRQERKSNEANELAIGAYNPLRTELSHWMDPEASYTPPVSHDVWTSLKQTQLRLVAHIPKRISTKLDAAEPLVDRIRFLSKQMLPKANAKNPRSCPRALPSRPG